MPELAWLDQRIREYMLERNAPNMLFGIMLDGRIVYLRGFGHNHDFGPLPENTPMRLASVSKTITTAAARHLISTGAIALDDFVFDRGQAGGGILPSSTYAPVGTPDARIGQITVSHLIHHRSGWYAGEHTGGQDFVWYDKECAAEHGVASPPGSTNKIRCILANPLAFDPGTDAKYSNINTLILGDVIEHVSGIDLESYVRTYVMRSGIGIPITEIKAGRTFREWQDPREPYYRTQGWTSGPWMFPTAFDNYGPAEVPNSYGAYAVEDAVPFGAFVASPAAMLEFARRYDIRYSTAEDSRLGMPVNGTEVTGNFNGSLSGFQSRVEQQEVPGVGSFRFFIATSFRRESTSWHEPSTLLSYVRDMLIDGSQVYPETTSDGFWTALGSPAASGVGGYNAPFRGLQRALDQTTAGSKIRLFPGAQAWTGVISTPMVIDAPLGAAVIGE